MRDILHTFEILEMDQYFLVKTVRVVVGDVAHTARVEPGQAWPDSVHRSKNMAEHLLNNKHLLQYSENIKVAELGEFY